MFHIFSPLLMIQAISSSSYSMMTGKNVLDFFYTDDFVVVKQLQKGKKKQEKEIEVQFNLLGYKNTS